MDVYFDANFWHTRAEKGDDGPGRPVEIQSVFSYGGYQWLVPAIYLCGQGIVTDLCRRIPVNILKDFYDKWRHFEDDQEKLTERQQILIEQENPLEFPVNLQLQIGGKALRGKSGSSISLLPPSLRSGREAVAAGQAGDQPGRQLAAAYHLDLTDGWVIWRHSFEWKDSCLRALSDLQLTISRGRQHLPCGYTFTTETGEESRVHQFPHPVTGKTIRFRTLRCEEEQILISDKIGDRFFQGFHMPSHTCRLEYQVEAGLSPKEDLLLLDCRQGDSPVRMEHIDGEKAGKKAAAISIIGGSDGPTSVFVAGKISSEAKTPNTRLAYSSLHFQPARQVTWYVDLQAEPLGPETFSLTQDETS